MTWHRINQSTDARTVSVNLAGVNILAIATADQWYAIEDRCSHAGCAFSEDGEIDGLVAVCDCHGSEFDISTGEVLARPASEPIRTFPTRVVDGTLEVEV